MPSFSVPAGAGPAGPRHGRRRRVNPDVVRPRPSTAASATPPAHQPPHQDAATTSPPYHASWLTSSSHGGTNRLSRRVGTGKEAPHGDQLPARGQVRRSVSTSPETPKGVPQLGTPPEQ